MLKKKICLLGYYGVGKTSLVAKFVSGMFSEKYLTTVGAKVDKKTLQVDGQAVTLMLWDLAGQEDGAPIKLNSVRDAGGILLVADGLRAKTLAAAVEIQQRAHIEFGRLPFLLLLNKADLRAQWEVQDADIADLQARGWNILSTSAKTGQNVEGAFLQLAKALLKADEDREEDDA